MTDHKTIREALEKANPTYQVWDSPDGDEYFQTNLINSREWDSDDIELPTEADAHLLGNAYTWLRQLLDENESLSQRLKDFEGCKGIEDYYRVLCDLREVKVYNERLKKERDELQDKLEYKYMYCKKLEEDKVFLKADKAVVIEALQKIADYDLIKRHGGNNGWNAACGFDVCKVIARTTLEQLKER